jgi:NADH:ubiquinone reductase (H+-translocating)
VTDALRLRNSLLGAFEAAAAHGARAEVGATRLVIVGGGASGVEVAGYSADFLIPSFAHDYPQLDHSQMQITLLELGDRLLPGLIPL